MTLDNKVLRETMLRLSRRAKSLDHDIYLFSQLSINSDGINMKESESALDGYMKSHDKRVYYLFGLGHHEAWKLIQNPYKSIIKGLIVHAGMYMPSHRVQEVLLKELGVSIEEPSMDLPQDERIDRKAAFARQVTLDYFFPHLLSIGEGTQIGNNATIVNHVYLGDFYAFGIVNIGRDVLIGGNCVIGPGVNVGNGVRINAGSYVFSDIPSGVVAAGNPARVMGPRKIRTVDLEDGVPKIKTSIYKTKL